MRKSLYLFLFLLNCIAASAQKINSEYKEGYVIKNGDTIKCKLFIDTRVDFPMTSIKTMIENDEITFFAGGPITAFGRETNDESIHYGLVDVERIFGSRRMSTLMYLKKTVAGTVDFYEYSYTVIKSIRKTVNGVEQPSASSTIPQNTTNYYIAKKDSIATHLATPIVLSSFKKKELEPYLGDYTELMAREEKKFSLKELIAAIKEYNTWYAGKTKSN